MATDFLLEIDGIKGESKDKAHKETIEVQSFSWGVQNSGSAASGSGMGAGKAHFNDLHLVSQVCKASPALAQACAKGTHIGKATLFVRKSGDKPEDYYQVILEDLMVSSYQSGGSDGSNTLPTDQFSLNYAKIEFKYAPQKEKGGLEGFVPFKYDIKATSSA